MKTIINNLYHCTPLRILAIRGIIICAFFINKNVAMFFGHIIEYIVSIVGIFAIIIFVVLLFSDIIHNSFK